jgi:hypothetical protein
MMNRDLMQRQMFRNGGGVVPMQDGGEPTFKEKILAVGRGVVPMAGGGAASMPTLSREDLQLFLQNYPDYLENNSLYDERGVVNPEVMQAIQMLREGNVTYSDPLRPPPFVPTPSRQPQVSPKQLQYFLRNNPGYLEEKGSVYGDDGNVNPEVDRQLQMLRRQELLQSQPGRMSEQEMEMLRQPPVNPEVDRQLQLLRRQELLQSQPGRMSEQEMEMLRQAPVYGMQEGGMAPMGMPPQGMPPQGAMMPEMAQSQQAGMDPAILEQMLAQASQGIGSLDEAEDYEQVMNMMTGTSATIAERRMELADLVGDEDAQQTPDSVLTLVQPVIMMAKTDEGIGGLAQDQMTEAVTGDMAGGIMSTIDMGAQEGPAPVNFRYGGAVQYMEPGGVAMNEQQQKDFDLLQQEYELNKNFMGQLIDKDAQAKAMQGQRDMTQAQMLFDLANTGLAIAAPGPRTMSVAEKLAYAAQQTELFPRIGARAAELGKFKQAQDQESRQMDTLAAQGAMDLRNQRITNEMKDIGTPYDIRVIDSEGNVIGVGRGPVDRKRQKELEDAYPDASVQFSPISTDAGKGPDFQTVLDDKGKAQGSFDINSAAGLVEVNKLLSTNKGWSLGKPTFSADTPQKPYNLIKSGTVVAVIPGSEQETKLLREGYSVAGTVSAPDEYDFKQVKLNMAVKIDGKNYSAGQLVNLTSRQMATLDPTAVDLSPMTKKDWLSLFKMSEEKYNSLSENELNILAGLATVENYFSKFGMSKDNFLALPEEKRLKLVGLAPDEKLMTLANNSIVSIKTKEGGGYEVQTLHTPDVFELVKGENGELLQVDAQSGKVVTLREAVDSKKPEYRVIRDTRTDVVTYVDINTAEGQKAVDRAVAENLANNATVITMGTVPADKQQAAKAFYIEGEKQIVLSFDGGRTYVNSEGETKGIPTEDAVPVSDTIANQVLRASKIRRLAGDQLQQYINAESSTIKIGEPGNTREVSSQQAGNITNAYTAALNGTGTFAKFQVFLDNVFAGALLPGDMFQETQADRQFLETVVILGRSALVLNPRFPVAEMERVQGLFPDTEALFVNPETQANKLIELKQAVVDQKKRNLNELYNNTMLDTKGMQDIVSNNSEIDRLLTLLTGVPDKYGLEDQATKDAVIRELSKQRDDRGNR